MKNHRIRKIHSFKNFRILDNTQNNTFVMCHICHIRASACHKRSSIIFQSIFILRIVILTSITFTQMRFFVVKYDYFHWKNANNIQWKYQYFPIFANILFKRLMKPMETFFSSIFVMNHKLWWVYSLGYSSEIILWGV